MSIVVATDSKTWFSLVNSSVEEIVVFSVISSTIWKSSVVSSTLKLDKSTVVSFVSVSTTSLLAVTGTSSSIISLDSDSGWSKDAQ